MTHRRIAIEQAATILFHEHERRIGNATRLWSNIPEEERRVWRVLAALPSAPPRFQIPPAVKVSL